MFQNFSKVKYVILYCSLNDADSYLVARVYVTRERGNFSWHKRYRFDTILLRAIFPYFPTTASALRTSTQTFPARQQKNGCVKVI